MSDDPQTLHHLAEITSLAMAVPTIVLAVAVVWTWGPAALKALVSRNFTPNDWFIVGVCVGFLGSVGDNLYWGLAWSAEFTDHAAADKLFALGVWSNIPFRQGMGIAAAYCHLRAATGDQSTLRHATLNRILLVSYLAAIAIVAALLFFRAGKWV